MWQCRGRGRPFFTALSRTLETDPSVIHWSVFFSVLFMVLMLILVFNLVWLPDLFLVQWNTYQLKYCFLSNHIHALCCLVSFCPRSLGSVSVTGTSSLMDWSDSPMTTDSTSYTKKAPSIGFYRSTKFFFLLLKKLRNFVQQILQRSFKLQKRKRNIYIVKNFLIWLVPRSNTPKTGMLEFTSARSPRPKDRYLGVSNSTWYTQKPLFKGVKSIMWTMDPPYL